MDVIEIENRALLASALAGLARPQKELDAKWFYDNTGSALFEDITCQPEYYPTRTEAAILRDNAGKLASFIPRGGALIELGSGASVKTRTLLDAAPSLGRYVPLDISGPFLQETAQVLRQDYPDLRIDPVVGDFMADLALPDPVAAQPKSVFFPGSTIGNLTPAAAIDLLVRLRAMGQVKTMILGADLVKDPQTLIAAYDDAAGVTAAFNRNVLARLNREAAASFQLDQFFHQARWNAAQSRIEMHLVSRQDQQARVGAEIFHFAKGESIHTENSHKYTGQMLRVMARDAGWSLAEMLVDEDALFSVCVLTAA